jgi:hypothetical protein
VGIAQAGSGKIVDSVFTTRTAGKATENGLAGERSVTTHGNLLRIASECG